MADISIQVTVNTGSDIGDTTLVNKFKRYAREQFGWKEQVPDPNFVVDEQNPVAPLIDNPVTYSQVIFVDNPMNQFWAWDKETTFQDAKNEVAADQEAFKNSVTLEVIVPE